MATVAAWTPRDREGRGVTASAHLLIPTLYLSTPRSSEHKYPSTGFRMNAYSKNPRPKDFAH